MVKCVYVKVVSIVAITVAGGGGCRVVVVWYCFVDRNINAFDSGVYFVSNTNSQCKSDYGKLVNLPQNEINDSYILNS